MWGNLTVLFEHKSNKESTQTEWFRGQDLELERSTIRTQRILIVRSFWVDIVSVWVQPDRPITFLSSCTVSWVLIKDNDNDKEVWKQLTPCLRYDSNLNGAITFNKKARRNYDLSVLYRLEMSVKTFFFLFETKEEQQNCHDFAVVFFVCRLAGRLICCKCHLGQGVTK